MQLPGHTVHHLKDCNLYSYSTYTVGMKMLHAHGIKSKYERGVNTGIYSTQDKQSKIINQTSYSLFDFKNGSYIPSHYSYTPRSLISKCTVLICKLWGFSQQCKWDFQSSWMWCCMVWWDVPDISKECVVIILKGQVNHREFFKASVPTHPTIQYHISGNWNPR